MLREYEPDLPKLLNSKRFIVVGEPGAGKSTVVRSIVLRLATAKEPHNDVPVPVSLRSYTGSLTELLAASIPTDVLKSNEIRRRYVFDGLDEVPKEQIATLVDEIRTLLASDVNCALVITARQAFFAAHSKDLNLGLSVFHLLDFDEDDLRDYARLRGLEPQKFIDTAFDVRVYEEVRNPLNASITISRLLNSGQLSPIRSENLAWVIGEVLNTRPVLEPLRLRRAVRLLGIAMETYSRNELTWNEAIRILSLGLDLDEDRARHLLGELQYSILIGTSTGIAFQLRSYGEMLAAEALSEQPWERVRQLAFFDDGSPNPSWMNAISLLAELHPQTRQFFIRRYPDWMLEASPAAFTEDERSAVTDGVITNLNDNGQFILHHPTVKARRVFRFATHRAAERLLVDLDSTRAEVKANAMVILGMRREASVIKAALPIALDTGRNDVVRYSAIVAVMNGGEPAHVDAILAVLDRADTFYDTLIECAVMLVAPEEVVKVIPYVLGTSTMLSAAFGRFRELRVRPAVIAVLNYLAANPALLYDIKAEGYLSPVVRSVADHWNDEVADLVVRVFVAAESRHVYGDGRLKEDLIQAIVRAGGQAHICSALIREFITANIRPAVMGRQLGQWLTIEHAERLIELGERDFIRQLSGHIPHGPVRDHLAPYSDGYIRQQDENLARYLAEDAQRQRERAESLAAKQHTMRTGRFDEVLNTAYSLDNATWPEITGDRRQWLAHEVSQWLESTDLNAAIIHNDDNSWRQPFFLEAILNLIEKYDLVVEVDRQLALSLRAWSFEPVVNYARLHGLSTAAQKEVITLLMDRGQPKAVLSHVLAFIEKSDFRWESEKNDLLTVVNDNAVEGHNQVRAMHILVARGVDRKELKTLRPSSNQGVRDLAFLKLVEMQDRETISRELHRLLNDTTALRAAEVPPPNESSAAWITSVREVWAWDSIRKLRRLALEMRLPYFCEMLTRASYRIQPAKTSALVKYQLRFAPEDWLLRQTSLVAEYERQRQLDEAASTPFDKVLRKLKTSTSLITLKVFVEGKTDLPVYGKLLRDLGLDGLADKLDIVGGWPNLLPRPPERLLDGCREIVIIMDGDGGRELRKGKQSYSDKARQAFKQFKYLPISLHVLERYGIENYFTRAALEAATGRNLSAFKTLPPDISIDDYLVNDLPDGRERLYSKDLNDVVAKHLTYRDIEGTDLADILAKLKDKVAQLRDA